MSISDEIRKWCDRNVEGRGNFVTDDSFSELLDLADRIDSEMVELPRSVDGQIWTGREVCFWTSAEQEGYHNFGCVALRDDKWYVEDVHGTYYEAESVWYERPDSLDCIADELDELVDAARWSDDSCEKLADLADRIRKLAKKEDTR